MIEIFLFSLIGNLPSPTATPGNTNYYYYYYYLLLFLQSLPVLMVSSTQSVVLCAQGLVRIKTKTLCVLMSVLLVVSVLLGWFWRIMLAFNPLSVQVMAKILVLCVCIVTLYNSNFVLKQNYKNLDRDNSFIVLS